MHENINKLPNPAAPLPAHGGMRVLCILILALLAAQLSSCGGKKVDVPDAAEAREPSASQETVAPSPGNVETADVAPADEDAAPGEDPGPADTPAESEPGPKWFLVAEITEPVHYTVFVDTDSVADEPGGKASLAKMVFFVPQRDTDGLVYNEVQIVSVIDCEARTYSYKSSKFFDGLGKMVYSENIGENQNGITPNSVSEHIAGFICDYKPPEARS